jgi:hypothetical protein
MDLGDHINAYCERHGSSWTAEPLNALSNAGFFYAAWRLWRHAGAGPPHLRGPQRSLAVLIGLVGGGSLAFHTLATVWAEILDVLFIGVFNVVFLVLFLRLVAHWPVGGAIAAGLGFVALDRGAGLVLPAGAFNGSLLYLPALTVLLALTITALVVAPVAGRRMGLAAAVFCGSLLARSLDQALCGLWPMGLHFVWHLLNAWVLFALATSLDPGRKGNSPG